jgi:hypothetical protein
MSSQRDSSSGNNLCVQLKPNSAPDKELLSYQHKSSLQQAFLKYESAQKKSASCYQLLSVSAGYATQSAPGTDVFQMLPSDLPWKAGEPALMSLMAMEPNGNTKQRMKFTSRKRALKTKMNA